MGTLPKPPGKAMYVAPRPDWDWLRIVQRKLYERSEEQVDYVFRKLWGLVTDPRNLRMALARVAGNRGRRTPGVDGITVGNVTRRAEEFVAGLRLELRSGTYRPSPVRRVLIPKIGAPGKFRPLGIPTVKDRERAGDSGIIRVSRCLSPDAPRSSHTGWPGNAHLTTPSITESRVHNERCTPGSGRGRSESYQRELARRPAPTSPESTSFAGKSHDSAVPTVFAPDAKKAVTWNATTKVSLELVKHKGGQFAAS